MVSPDYSLYYYVLIIHCLSFNPVLATPTGKKVRCVTTPEGIGKARQGILGPKRILECTLIARMKSQPNFANEIPETGAHTQK